MTITQQVGYYISMRETTIVKRGYSELFTLVDGVEKRIRKGTKAYAYYWQRLDDLGACTQEIYPGGPCVDVADGTYTVKEIN